MFKIKHFLDSVEADDGQRIWIEPIGLTLDLKEMCQIPQTLPHVAPPLSLWQWFDQHPDGYDYFRGQYHDVLNRSNHRGALQELIYLSRKENITLLHQGDDPAHNSATALYEFLSELEAYCKPD